MDRNVLEWLQMIDKADMAHKPWERDALAYAFVENLREMGDNRLAEICEAERSGRLVILPCKVGDTVYKYNTDNLVPYGKPKEKQILGMRISFITTDKGAVGGFYADAIGKTVFLTREQAEAALQEGRP